MVTLSKPAPIQQRLINSGHYRQARDGRLRSVHFRSLENHPNREGLKITPLISGTVADIKPGRHYPFRSEVRETDNHFTGLEQAVRIEVDGKPPIYVFDNHHNSYFAWHEALSMGYIRQGAILATIDRHADLSPPRPWSTSNDLAKVASYVKESLWISEFILPAVAKELFSQCWLFYAVPGNTNFLNHRGNIAVQTNGTRHLHRIGHLYENEPASFKFYNSGRAYLEQLIKHVAEPKNLVLDIDLDAIVPTTDRGRMPSSEIISRLAKKIAELGQQVGLVTMATSPAFADQIAAIDLAKQIATKIIAA